jgi:hypothetical protein
MRRPSPALVIACTALAVALAGTGYAVTSLPANSVGPKQLKANAVTGAKVKDGTLLAADFKAGQLTAAGQGAAGPAGPTGPAGSAGPAGPAGSARAYGRIALGGTIVDEDSSGIASVTHPATGQYCVVPRSGIDVTKSVPVVSLDWEATLTLPGLLNASGRFAHIEAAQPNIQSPQCPATAFAVYAYDITGASPAVVAHDSGFFIMVP